MIFLLLSRNTWIVCTSIFDVLLCNCSCKTLYKVTVCHCLKWDTIISDDHMRLKINSDIFDWFPDLMNMSTLNLILRKLAPFIEQFKSELCSVVQHLSWIVLGEFNLPTTFTSKVQNCCFSMTSWDPLNPSFATVNVITVL